MVEVLGRLDWHAPEVEAAIYYCCREGLQNAMKHAGPLRPGSLWDGRRESVLPQNASPRADDVPARSLNHAGTDSKLRRRHYVVRDRRLCRPPVAGVAHLTGHDHAPKGSL